MNESIFKNKYLKLKYIPYIIFAFLINGFIKLLKLKKQKIILIGGHCGEKYGDNSAEIHKYLLRKYPEFKIYWMINKKVNPEVVNIEGTVIKIGGIKNYLAYLNCDVCYFSHSLSTDIAPVIDKILPERNKPIRVHLSHGIEGLKRNIYPERIEDVDFYICSSKNEKEIKQTEWGIAENKLIVTGVPRYDRLYRSKNIIPQKSILYLPTWREWLYEMEEEEFMQSEFVSKIQRVINDVKLNQILIEAGFRLEVLLHPFMQKKIPLLREVSVNSNIAILGDDEDISDKIVTSSLLITDYSSVSWDFLYMRKNIIFFQFDQEKYLNERGAYMDFKKELFGEVVFSVDDLIQNIKQLLNDRLEYDDEIINFQREKFFTFFDDKNCERVIQHTLNVD
ncbi:CDP-glycerol glycerophosphotransferase family protein [Bacillus mycoides]|uniref:CDP-glycerol glycerophosphotransferase family protein n=1 Tax=Bacillus mycoides TaxID=1405 RepID=UPI003D656F2B